MKALSSRMSPQEQRLRAMCAARRVLRALASDEVLSKSARMEAAKLASLQPSPSLVQLVAENRGLTFAHWRWWLVRTQHLVAVMAAIRQGGRTNSQALALLASGYPSAQEIKLMCYSHAGFAKRLLARSEQVPIADSQQSQLGPSAPNRTKQAGSP